MNPAMRISVFGKMIALMNDRGLVIDCINKLDPDMQLNLGNCISQLYTIYQLEKKLVDEEKVIRFNENIDAIIVRECEKLKSLPKTVDLGKDYSFCCNLIQEINNNRLDRTDENLQKLNKKLTVIEKTYFSIQLAIPYVKGGLYKYLQLLGMNEWQIAACLSMSTTQIKNYIKFCNFIQMFPYLIRSHMSFTFITKNMNKITDYINENEEIKLIAKKPFSFFSAE